jgi:actin related protein 2/3 complex subunit 1A/1B
VSSIDWSPVNNKIVSCSHDRNAFVWTYYTQNGNEPAQWKPSLVVLRIDRAAIDVKWSLDGLRFAVTSAAKCVPVCTYETQNDWFDFIILDKYMVYVVIIITMTLNILGG